MLPNKTDNHYMLFFKQYKWLLPLLSFNIALVIIRMIRTQSIDFVFIPWNLFLAGIPLLFAYWLVNIQDKRTAWGTFCLWLLFFPNAMYIVTDLFHLHEYEKVPQWFDLLLLFSAALNGVLMGMASLRNAEKFLRKNIPAKLMPYTVYGLFLLCGYGIYLGRYMRWNSWDIVAQPFGLLLNIAHDIHHPLHNTQSWMLTGLFATWLFILYKYASQIIVKRH